MLYKHKKANEDRLNNYDEMLAELVQRDLQNKKSDNVYKNLP